MGSLYFNKNEVKLYSFELKLNYNVVCLLITIMILNTFEMFQQPENTASDLWNNTEYFYKLEEYTIESCASDEKNRSLFLDPL